MDFSEYQDCAQRTSKYRCYIPFSGEQLGHPRLHMALLGLGGEAGELLDYFKKVLHHGHPFDRARALKEAGDALWYLAELCSSLGVSLEEVARLNIEKLGSRYGEGGFSAEASLNRRPGDV